jgi:hypothetical protein
MSTADGLEQRLFLKDLAVFGVAGTPAAPSEKGMDTPNQWCGICSTNGTVLAIIVASRILFTLWISMKRQILDMP